MANDLTVSIIPSGSQLSRAFFSLDVTGFLQREINQLAMGVERYAKQLTPVRTGRLRASIFTSPQLAGLRAVVSTNTNYAIYVHDGTKYIKTKRPFMTMGAAFAQVSQLKDINVRLDKEFVADFKANGV